VPTLGVIYHLRWQATRIFDTATDRAMAAAALKEWGSSRNSVGEGTSVAILTGSFLPETCRA
jgi:hypothetical protein